MACCQATKLVIRLPVQSFLTILLTTMCPLFFSHIRPCQCSGGSNHTRIARYTWNTTFEQMDQGLLFRRGSGSGDESSSSVTLQPGSLGYYYMSSNNSSQLGFNLTEIPGGSSSPNGSIRGRRRAAVTEVQRWTCMRLPSASSSPWP
jgi:interleukin-1 receptor-associated kinase 1